MAGGSPQYHLAGLGYRLGDCSGAVLLASSVTIIRIGRLPMPKPRASDWLRKPDIPIPALASASDPERAKAAPATPGTLPLQIR